MYTSIFCSFDLYFLAEHEVEGDKFYLVTIDLCRRFSNVLPITADSITKTINRMLKIMHMILKSLVSDRGTEYQSTKFNKHLIKSRNKH